MGGSAHLSMTLAAVGAGCAAHGWRASCLETFGGGAVMAGGFGGGAALVQQGQDLAGHAVGAAVGGMTGFFFTRRYMSLRQPFMPNGIIAGAAVAGFAYNCYKANEWHSEGW